MLITEHVYYLAYSKIQLYEPLNFINFNIPDVYLRKCKNLAQQRQLSWKWLREGNLPSRPDVECKQVWRYGWCPQKQARRKNLHRVSPENKEANLLSTLKTRFTTLLFPFKKREVRVQNQTSKAWPILNNPCLISQSFISRSFNIGSIVGHKICSKKF